MKKQFLKIKISDGIETVPYNDFGFPTNEKGEVYINKFGISTVTFTDDSIYIEMLGGGESTRIETLTFHKSAMGEYHRIKRELGID